MGFLLSLSCSIDPVLAADSPASQKKIKTSAKNTRRKSTAVKSSVNKQTAQKEEPAPEPPAPPSNRVRKFIMTKGSDNFNYIRMMKGEPRPALFQVLISPDASLPRNAMWVMMENGPCPGTFKLGDDQKGIFNFSCTRGLQAHGELLYDSLAQKLSGKGKLSNGDDLEFREE